MKAAACVTAGLLLVTSSRAGAQGKAKPSLELDLSMPDVPAFSILGASPTQIERPTTPKAFALSLLAAAPDNTNLIPSKYAVVLAPYWMQRASVTIDRYARPTVAQSLAQTFAVSLATSRSTSLAAAKATDVSAGFSASLWAGHASAAFADRLAGLLVGDVKLLAAEGLADDLAAIVKAQPDASAVRDTLGQSPSAALLAAFLDRPEPETLKSALAARYTEYFTRAVTDSHASTLVDAETLAAQRASALAASLRALNASIDALFAADPLPLLAGPVGDLLRHVPEASTDAPLLRDARRIIAYRVLTQAVNAARAMRDAAESSVTADVARVRSEDKLRVGWMFAVSGAIASRIPDDRIADTNRLRWAAWASPSYRADGKNLEVIAIAKWIQREPADGVNLFDAGVRVVKQAGSAAFSAEYLNRVERFSASSNASTERATVNVDYKVADRVFVTAAFGKDFADPSAGKPTGGLVSVLGVGIGLSRNPLVDVP